MVWIPGQGDLGYPPSYRVVWSGYTTLGVGAQHNLLSPAPALYCTVCGRAVSFSMLSLQSSELRRIYLPRTPVNKG